MPAKTPMSTEQKSRGAVARWIREKWFVTGLVVAALIILGSMAIMAWSRPTSLSVYLPRETIGFIEVSTDFTDIQWEMLNAKAPEVVNDAVRFLNETFQVDFTKDVHPWLARRAGLALLPTQTGGQESQQLAQYKPIIFLEIQDEKQALAFFEKRHLQGISEKLQRQTHRGAPMYSYLASNPYTLIQLGRYLIVAPDEATAKAIIDATHDKNGTLAKQQALRDVQENLPHNHLAFGFIKPRYLASQTAGDPFGIANIFTNRLSSEGLAITVDEDHLIAQHVARFDSTAQSAQQTAPTQQQSIPPQPTPQPYRANLAKLFSPNITFFAGGTRASETITQITTLLASKDIAGSMVETALKQAIDVTLSELTSEEFTELFSREYAIGLDNDALVIAIELGNANSATSGSATKNFMKLKAILQKNPRFAEQTFYESITGNIGILSTSEQARDQAITRANNTANTSAATSSSNVSWKNSATYQSSVKPQLDTYTKKASDIIFIEGSLLKDYLPPEWNFLARAQHLSLASSSLENGIKTTLLFTP